MATEQEIAETMSQYSYVAGLDEAGAGPLASSLFVAAVVLPAHHSIKGLADSKKLSEKKRDLLFDEIIAQAVEYSIIELPPQEIDQLNIYQARMEGFRRAASALKHAQYCVIDGNVVPTNLALPADCCVKGDAKIECVSAASILAKVARDRLMMEQALLYPQYGFEKHKGYGTALHLKALQEHGPTPIHRLSYRPVKEAASAKSS